MICLLDMGLLALDLSAWNTNCSKCLLPGIAMALHKDWLLRYRVRVPWLSDFFNGFPWNQPAFPPQLLDYCTILMKFYNDMQTNGLLIETDAEVPDLLPVIVPDLLVEPHLAVYRASWLSIFAGLLCDTDAPVNGVAVPTWEQPETENRSEITVENAGEIKASLSAVPLLKSEADWQAFIGQFHKPDLDGVRVAVLGGERASFERARQRLMDIYNVAECRRLPPHSEQNRSESQTKQRLSQVDLVIVCTNRMAHSDFTQLRNIEEAGSLPCVIVPINSDSADQIVQAVVEHYRT